MHDSYNSEPAAHRHDDDVCTNESNNPTLQSMVDARLSRREVLIGGLGAATAAALAAQGARVGFVDRDEAAARRLEADLGGAARAELADLTDIAALRAAFARLRGGLGPVSVLVNNAARDDRHRIEDVATPEAFARDAGLVHRFYDQRRALLRERLMRTLGATRPAPAEEQVAVPPIDEAVEATQVPC